jgi:hypothetical protein
MKNLNLMIFLAASLMILYYGRIDISIAPHSEIPDIINYRQMALASPGFDTAVSRNFGYRILLPYIAGLMPFDVDTNFYILTVLMSLVLPFVFMRFLRAYGLKEDTAFYLAILFVLNRYTFGYAAWNYYDVHDLLTFILIPLFLIALKNDRFVLMSVILGIGVLNRETILFLVPAALFRYWFIQKERSSALKMAASILPAAVVFFLLRSLLVTEQASQTSFMYSMGKIKFDEAEKLFNPVTYYRIANTFIPLTLIPMVFWKTTKEFFKKYPHFLILIATYYASCFLAGDTERLIVPMFPVFFLLTGIIFEQAGLNELKGRLIVLSACLLTIPHHIFFRYKLPHRDWKVVVSILTLAFVTAYFFKLKKEKQNVLGNNSDI